MERNPLIVIPSRAHENGGLGEQCFDSDGTPAIVGAWRRAIEADVGNVIVDCPDDEVAKVVGKAGAYVYRSKPDPVERTRNYRTASDAERVAATVNKFDRFYNHDVIVTLADHLSMIDPRLIRALMYPLAVLEVDIATVVSPISEEEAGDSETVKVAVEWSERRRVHVLTESRVGRATAFSRKLEDIGEAPYFRHIPIYAYKRASLDRFVRFGPTAHEMEEYLEPSRAMENGMRVDVVTIDEETLSVGHEKTK